MEFLPLLMAGKQWYKSVAINSQIWKHNSIAFAPPENKGFETALGNLLLNQGPSIFNFYFRLWLQLCSWTCEKNCTRVPNSVPMAIACLEAKSKGIVSQLQTFWLSVALLFKDLQTAWSNGTVVTKTRSLPYQLLDKSRNSKNTSSLTIGCKTEQQSQFSCLLTLFYYELLMLLCIYSPWLCIV